MDVFFVISGFLITSVILADQRAGTFRLVDFYERRARRILPALFVVLAASLPFALVWMIPARLENYAQSLAATALFGSNALFWLTSGYFDSAAVEKPLLHTWSLGVEEQFYLLFPLALLLAWRWAPRRLMWLTCGGAILSLAAGELAWRLGFATAGFFLTPFRAWELLVGSATGLLAFRGALSRVRPRIADAAASFGLVLIVGSVLLYDSQTPSPGLFTAVPVGGAALVLAFARAGSISGGLLSAKWMVGIGLISYSAYLWHQPLFAFARIYSTAAPPPIVFAALTVLSLLLAYVTWRLVELPFRNRARVSSQHVLAFSLVGTLGFAGIGTVGHFAHGFERPQPASPIVIQRWTDTLKQDGVSCSSRQPAEACVFPPNGGVTWTLVGDSHAGFMGGPLLALAQEHGDGFTELTMPTCYLAPGFDLLMGGAPTICDTRYQAERLELLLSSPPGVVVIAGRLPLYLTPTNFDNREGGVEKRAPAVLSEFPPSMTSAQRQQLIRESIVVSTKALIRHGHRVVLVYPEPETGWNVPLRIAELSQAGLTAEDVTARASVSYAVSEERVRPAYDILDDIGDDPSVARVYPEKMFCNRREVGRCETVLDNTALYVDYDHLSPLGMSLLAREVFRAGESLLGRTPTPAR